jgi:hypothetical protein
MGPLSLSSLCLCRGCQRQPFSSRASPILLAQQYKQHEQPKRLPRILATVGLLALVCMHIPRTTGSVLRYTRDADPKQMFASSDFDQLQSAIGDREVYIDIHGNARTIGPIVIEFGRRNLKPIWAPHAWHIIGAFRGNTAPPLSKIPDLRLIDAGETEHAHEQILVETPRYKLLRRPESSSDALPK